jgi:diguanylate cyclase (GGDEF)-like protein
VATFDWIKGLIFGTAVLLTAIPAAAAPPAQLTSLHSIATLSNTEASKHLPVSFEATVTYFRSFNYDMFVQDGNDAIYVSATTSLRLAPGDRILVRGTTHESFRPYVDSNNITFIGHGALPKPIHASFEQLIRAETDCRVVTVRALVLSADLVPDSRSPRPTAYLRMLVDGGPVDANLDSADETTLKGLLDAQIEITGPGAGHFDNKMQETGILLHVQSMDGIKILKRPASDPWSLPTSPMDRIITGYWPVDRSQRMHVRGTITYDEPGSAFVLQDGEKSLWITTQDWSPLRIGNVADAIGFPDVENGFLTLVHSEIRESPERSPITPSLFTWRELAQGGNQGHSHSFDLVSIEGEVVAEVRQATEDEYVLESDGHLFSAVLRHSRSPNPTPLPPMQKIPLGSRIRVTGICMLAAANPFNGDVPFNILLRKIDDIAVVAQPSWMNSSRLLLFAGVLLGLVLALGIRGWYLERKNRRQIGSLAYVEQRRGRILEDINHSKPLASILERITELVSVRLNGAACWCQITNGATLGNRPAQLGSSLRTVEHTIAARTGLAHGSLYAAFDARTRPSHVEKEALGMAAELATLAIETSRLYSDLVHRSEFDLLTDVQNRFALEKTLDAQIHTTRQSAGVFGLIYIDLNEFKQVNDLYGHHAGDLYLQELTRRLKTQLRPGDTLARLGGDEFAILVPQVHNRTDVEEIAVRLQSCFDEPFKGDGFELRGSASIGIALYPEDANSAESLLRAADAAMYAIKYSRPGRGGSSRDQSHANLASGSRR